MSALIPQFEVTAKTTQTVVAADLGKLYCKDGKWFRLVKAGGTLVAGEVVVTALSSGVPTWVVSTTTTANNHLAVGLVPTGHVGAVENDYLYIQVSGPAKGRSAAAIAAGAPVGSSTTAGEVDDATIGAGVGAIGVALEAASGADESIDIMLKGLL